MNISTNRSRTRALAALLLSGAILLISGCASTPPPPDPTAGIDACLEYARQAGEQTARSLRDGGVGVVVVADGRVVMAEGFGYADEESRTAIDADTVFRIGSVTKLFTGFSVMQLVESGMIDLDAPMTDYIPELSIRTRGAYPAFTVRDVMTHEAGLPGDLLNDWASGETDAPGWEARYRDYPALLADTYATYPPRTVFSYSNIGYSLLGLLVERVTGTSYSDYVEQNVLAPLNMDSSGLYLEDSFADRVATGYSTRRSGFGDLAQIRDIPAGSMYVSLADMGRFMEMIVGEGTAPIGSTIVSEQTFAEMTRRQNADVELDFGFQVGLTFWLFDLGIPDARLVNHLGNIPPYNACLIADPDLNLAVFTVTGAEAGADPVLDLAIRLTRSLEANQRAEDIPDESIYDLPEVPLSEETIQAVTGTWIGPMGVLEISGRRGRLFADMGPVTVTGIHRGDGLISLEVRALGITVMRMDQAQLILHEVADGCVFETIYYGLSIGLVSRCDPPPVTEIWRERAGEYEVLNPGGDGLASGIGLRYNPRSDELVALVLDRNGRVSMILPLEVVNDTTVVTGGLGRNANEVMEIRLVNGEEHLFASGFELRRLDDARSQ